MIQRILYVGLITGFCILGDVTAQNTSNESNPVWGNWEKWGEQNDGTYRNPIIPADYSDIDCIQVGDDYYAISSTFQFSPGMTLLHSKDLVNWEFCGNIISDLTQIGTKLNWDQMDRYARGVWAGTLRYHNGRFYLFFGTPDEGYFMTSSSKPEGPWEPLTPLLLEAGWDDCTAIWNEDGKACFVGTHFADGYKTYLFPMAKDGKSINRKSAKLIHSGNGREANKLIKVGEWYYLVFSEHKPGTGRYVMARRSKKLFGPYKEEKQLALDAMDKMQITQLARRCYRELSGGQQQRVLLARALCATRKMLLLDEPVSGLDPKVTAEMYALIEKLNCEDGITVIMISHDIAAAVQYASHILHIGDTVFFGTKADYLESPQGRLFAAKKGGDAQ